MSHKLCGPGSLAGRRTHGMMGPCMRASETVLVGTYAELMWVWPPSEMIREVKKPQQERKEVQMREPHAAEVWCGGGAVTLSWLLSLPPTQTPSLAPFFIFRWLVFRSANWQRSERCLATRFFLSTGFHSRHSVVKNICITWQKLGDTYRQPLLLSVRPFLQLLISWSSYLNCRMHYGTNETFISWRRSLMVKVIMRSLKSWPSVKLRIADLSVFSCITKWLIIIKSPERWLIPLPGPSVCCGGEIKSNRKATGKSREVKESGHIKLQRLTKKWHLLINYHQKTKTVVPPPSWMTIQCVNG